jgi:hypothetical protein
MEEQNTQYMVDFLSITLDLEKPFVMGNKINDTCIANNKTKIVKESILCENYKIINFLLENFNINEECISDIISDCYYSTYNYTNNYHKLIKWLGEKNIKIFKITMAKLINKISIYDYNMIYVLKNIFNKINNMYLTKRQFIKHVCETFRKIMTIYSQNEKNFSNFEYICLLIEIFQENQEYLQDTNYYLKLFDIILLNQHTNLKLLEKFIKYYGIKNIVKKHLESKELNFIPILIKSKSLEKITWFFDNIQEYTNFIKKSNYLDIFKVACDTGDIEIAKYIYNIIELCGLEITKQGLERILNNIIYSIRWDDKTKNNIVYELINLGIKPPSGYPQLTEYYNNLKIYS